MDLWQLQIFCKVVEQHSFSRAGEAIHLTQPTVSSHIKALEEHFGCRLIDRLGKEAVPTKAGRLLYDYALKLIQLRHETEAALAQLQGKIRGRLVVGGSSIPGAYLLPRAIGQFKIKYPEVTISLNLGDTQKIVQDTLGGMVEIGMVGAYSGAKGIVQHKILEDEMRLIVPADHKWSGRKSISLDMLQTEPFIVREAGSGTLLALQKSLQKQDLHIEELNVVAEIGSTEAVIQGIKCGVGVSILSTIAVMEELQSGLLAALTVNGIDLTRNFYLTRHKYRTPSPLCIAFEEFILQNKNLF